MTACTLLESRRTSDSVHVRKPQTRQAAFTTQHVPKMNRRSQILALAIAGGGLISALAMTRMALGSARSNELVSGDTFEVVGEIYAVWVTKDLNTRKPEIIAIVPLRLRGPEIVSVHVLPRGSRIRIVRRSESRWPAFLYPDRYLVVSTSIDNPAGLPVVLDLAQGNEGTSTPLNPALFRPLP